jgi:hypothetical protein
MDQEEQFASRKTPRSKVYNFLIGGKIRNIYLVQGPRGDQDGDPSHGFSNGFGGLLQQHAQAVPGHWWTTTAT